MHTPSKKAKGEQIFDAPKLPTVNTLESAKSSSTPYPTPIQGIRQGGVYKKGDYTIRSDKLQEVITALEVETPQVDAFASPQNSKCPVFWDVNNSAFERNWKAQGLLWINPPFKCLGKVVEKVERDQAHCLLLCPDQPKAKWWGKLQKLTLRSYYFAPGTHLFEVEGQKKLGPTPWGVWVMYINPNLPNPAEIRVLKNTEGRETQLKIPIRLLCEEREIVQECTALIDTGAEICVLRKGLVPEEYLSPAKKPLRLVGANERRLEGGEKEVTLILSIWALPKNSAEAVEFRIPTTFYVADIREPAILSYDWCRRKGIDILPRAHGLICRKEGVEYWVEGISRKKSQVNRGVQTLTSVDPPRALDLFSGTGSTTKILREAGLEVTSLDVDPRWSPTICTNILDWDFYQYPQGHFSLITASPPCTEFSRAKTVGPRDFLTADQLVLKTLEIIQYFQPQRWWLETPRYGELPKRPFMANLNFWDVDYCQVSLCGFKKPTRIFGSPQIGLIPSKLCDGVHCQNLGEGKRHLRPLGGHFGNASKKLTYPIPQQVVLEASGLVVPQGEGGQVDQKRVRFLLPPSENPTPAAPNVQTNPKGFTGAEAKPSNRRFPATPVRGQAGAAFGDPPGFSLSGGSNSSGINLNQDFTDSRDLTSFQGDPASPIRGQAGESFFEEGFGKPAKTEQEPPRIFFAGSGECEGFERGGSKQVLELKLDEPLLFNSSPEASSTSKGESHGDTLSWGQTWVKEQIKESAVWARDPLDHALAKVATDKIMDRFKETVMCGKYLPNPPVRGPHGEAEIWVREGATPVALRAYRMQGSRGEAHRELIEDCIHKEKMIPGVSSWNLPSFPVQKANGKFRLVQDFRELNAQSIQDGHPLPRIIDLLHQQGKNQIWSKMDLVDGYHQMPLKKEHQHFTCTTSPQGVVQWTVLVMGLKSAGSQFQRMMEWVLRDCPNTAVYLDDILVGSKGESLEELVENHTRDVWRVLETFEQHQITCSPAKSKFFQQEVGFLGHILRDGVRTPAPGKLLPL